MTEYRSQRNFDKFSSKVSISPAAGQSHESIQADIERSHKLSEDLRARGVQEWRSYMRGFRKFKFAWTKEVGPPRWRFPRPYFKAKGKPFMVDIGIGWNYTCYCVIFAWRVKE